MHIHFVLYIHTHKCLDMPTIKARRNVRFCNTTQPYNFMQLWGMNVFHNTYITECNDELGMSCIYTGAA